MQQSNSGYRSADDRTFLDTVTAWIAERHEVLALIRHSHSAGAKDFEFFNKADDFCLRLRGLSPRACITVFRRPQLLLRGRVDEDLIIQAVSLIPDGVEFLIVNLEPTSIGNLSWYSHSAGETHEELRESLRDEFGNSVAVGPFPPWFADGEDVTSAVVPNPDGSVTTGAY